MASPNDAASNLADGTSNHPFRRQRGGGGTDEHGARRTDVLPMTLVNTDKETRGKSAGNELGTIVNAGVCFPTGGAGALPVISFQEKLLL